MAKFLRQISDFSRVELGSGHNPQEGFVHVEYHENFPKVDIVCDLVNENLPIANGVVRHMIAFHLIEHIPWRKLPFVLNDWARVMSPGGKLFIRTPNLRKICEQYLKGEITPEWPGDMKELTQIFGQFGPSEWAIVKLFSGQDYVGNTHYFCLDPDSAKRLFERHGFYEFKEVDIEPKFSPYELQFFVTRK